MTTDERKQDAFGEQLPDETPRLRTERRSQRQLTLPSDRLGEYQIRDVRARDQHDERYGAEQREKRGPDTFVQHRVVDRVHAHAPPSVRGREFTADRRSDSAHIVTGLLDRDAGTQPADHSHHAVASILARRIDGERHEYLRTRRRGHA